MSGDTASTPRRRTRARSRGEVTIEQVARRAGVSVATVSRALRGLPNVAPTTRLRVEQVARDLDYHVDATASRLARGITDTVGLAVPNINDWYFSQVASGVEAVLSEEGFDLSIYSIADAAARDRLLTKATALRRLDGLVLVDVLLRDLEIERLSGLGDMHVVTVGQRTSAFPSVTVDNVSAGELATRHLLNLGHERIGFIGDDDSRPLDFHATMSRRVGYVAALDQAGIADDPHLTAHGQYTMRGGMTAMAELMSAPGAPTAVFCCSDEMAMGALRALGELGLNVPGDVSVVGFDDHELAEVFNLSTVRQDPVWQGASAARLLLANIAGEQPETQHVYGEARLVVRGSSGVRRARIG